MQRSIPIVNVYSKAEIERIPNSETDKVEYGDRKYTGFIGILRGDNTVVEADSPDDRLESRLLRGFDEKSEKEKQTVSLMGNLLSLTYDGDKYNLAHNGDISFYRPMWTLDTITKYFEDGLDVEDKPLSRVDVIGLYLNTLKESVSEENRALIGKLIDGNNSNLGRLSEENSEEYYRHLLYGLTTEKFDNSQPISLD